MRDNANINSVKGMIESKDTVMNDFLQEELRDGFLVDKSRKALWKIELDIMEDIDRICKKHGIKYSVLGGALIGAIRHKGFIPWDDDMDIGMLRDDYEKFIEIAPKELDSRYFLQTTLTDPEYYDVIVRVRDKNSTGICRKDLRKNVNNGVFIEIYPFDAVNPNRILYSLQQFRIKILSNLLHYSCYKLEKSFIGKTKMLVADICVKLWGKERIYTHMGLVASKYNRCGFEYVDELVTHYNCKYLYADMKDTIDVPYEYLLLSIPVGYDRCLKTTYGDYMVMPPEEKRVEHHNKVVYYDPFNIYSDAEVKKAAIEYFEA